MSRYAAKPYQLGPWYLALRDSSPAWHRCRYDKRQRTTERVSLHTTDFDEAKRRLDVWWAENLSLASDDLPPSKVKLSDVLQDYWVNQGSKLRSAETVKIFIRYWGWWGAVPVSEVRSAIKQEAFRLYLSDKGLAPNSVNRCLEVGRAAIRRSWKRGAISSAPFIQTLSVMENKPMGRPMTPEQCRALYLAAAPHLKTFLLLALGTGARPEAIFELTWGRVDFDAGLIDLRNPDKAPTKKRRPVVKLPPVLAEHLKTLPRSFKSERRDIADVPWVVSFRGKQVRRLDTAWDKACKASGVSGVSPYSTRHTVARYLRSEGVSMDSVADQLGHRMPGRDITHRYTANSPDYLAAPCDALNRLLLFIYQA